MTKLCDIVKIKNNDVSSLTFEVLEDKEIELINLGFDPKLKYIFLSKGHNHTIKLINRDLETTSFDFGDHGYTLISNNLKEQKKKILNCITDDFGIAYIGDAKYLNKTSKINSLTDKENMSFLISVFWNNNSSHFSMHRDNSFFKSFSSLHEVDDYINEYYTITNKMDLRLSEVTGCNILEYNVIGKSCKDMEIDL